MLEVLLFGLLAALCLSVVLVSALTLRRLSGKVTLDLDLGSGALAQARAERNEARAVADALRARLTGESGGTQPLQSDVTPPVTAKHSLVTVTAGPAVKVTGYTESGQAFPLPQEDVPVAPKV